MPDIRFHPFRVDTTPGSYKAWVADKELTLYPREHAILAYLCAHPGEPRDKEEFYRAVYPEHADRLITDKDYNVLSTYVSQLRKKIRAAHPDKGYDLLIEDISKRTPPRMKAYIQLRAPYGPGEGRRRIFGRLMVDLETGLIGVGRGQQFKEVVVGLLQKRFLLALALQPDEIISRKKIYESVYGDHPPEESRYSKERFERKFGKQISKLLTALDEAILGASVFIEKTKSGYRFTPTPVIAKAARPAAALAHDQDTGEEDEGLISIADTYLTPKGNLFSVLAPPSGQHGDRGVFLDASERRLLLHLAGEGNYDRYIHVAELARTFPTLKGEERKGTPNTRIMEIAKRLEAKVNPLLPYPFIQITEQGNFIGLGARVLPVPLLARKRIATADTSEAFKPGAPRLAYGELEFDRSCHAIRNRNNKKDVIILPDAKGKILEKLLLHAGSPVELEAIIAAADTTFKSLKDGGASNKGLLGEIDLELGKIGLPGIIFSTPSLSHVMLDNNPDPMIPEEAKTVGIREGATRIRISEKFIKITFSRANTYILGRMLAGAGQICFRDYAREEHAEHFPLKGKTRRYSLAEMNERAFGLVMAGLAEKLNSVGNTSHSLFRNYRGCYRFGPAARYALA